MRQLEIVLFIIATVAAVRLSDASMFSPDRNQNSEQMSRSMGAAAAAAAAADSPVSSDAGELGDDGTEMADNSRQVQAQAQVVQAVRLPKINIYASENEVKKLLGIDNRIDYVTNGQLNTYPLGFTIPMGYHLSDMIFNWQNLGPTNVNYSISLVIGNPVAVERPLINITRSGLIPRHEQVFKITLPCSGKLTDEVDVQVLINIQGLIPVGGDLNDQLDSSSSSSSQPLVDFQLARAVQNAHHQTANELPRISNSTTSSTASSVATSTSNQIADQLQADGPPIQMRQVAHTIAIKRKKICTMHPVPVQPVTRSPEPFIRPPNQVPGSGAQVDSMPLNERSTSGPPSLLASQVKWPGINVESQQQQQTIGTTLRMTPTSTTTTTTTTTTPEPPAHLHTWPMASSSTSSTTSATTIGADLMPQANGNQRGSRLPVGPPPPAQLLENPLIELLRQQQQQQQQAPSGPQISSSGNPLLLALIVMSLVLIAMLLLAAAAATTTASTNNSAAAAAMRHAGGHCPTIDKLNALTNCILRRTGAAGAAGAAGINSHSNTSMTNANNNNNSNKFKSMPIGTMNTKNNVGAFGIGNTGALGFSDSIDFGRTHAFGGSGPFAKSVGLSTISGRLHQQQQQQQYYYKQQQNYLITGPNYYQQQQQQYHHYQCPPDLLFGTPTQSSATTTTTTTIEPYHQINMSNNQTTKLYLGGGGGNGGNGGRSILDTGTNYTIDNNYTTAPIVPQSRSDSGSVYQTIY